MIIKHCTIEQADLFSILENIMKTTSTNGMVFDNIIDLLESTPSNSPLFSAAKIKADEIIFTRHPRYLKPEFKLAKYVQAAYFYGLSQTPEGKGHEDMLYQILLDMRS